MERTATNRQESNAWLLVAGIAYALAVAVPMASREPGGVIVVPLLIAGLSLVGWAVGWAAQRHLWSSRFAPLVAIHLAYLLSLLIAGAIWDDELFRVIPLLAGGPLTFFGYEYGTSLALSSIGAGWRPIVLVGGLTLPALALMLASVWRRGPLAIVLTALGTAMWYLLGFGALLSRIV